MVEARSWRVKSLLLDVCTHTHDPRQKNSLGWNIYPEGLYTLLKSFAKLNLPIFILENGICTEDDLLRWDFIRAHLCNVHKAMQEGVKVMGICTGHY